MALALRVWLLERSGWLLDGDDALSTLMAFSILDGDRPIMLKNQVYGGAWEPYAMAASYALFGASRIAARLPVLTASVAFVLVTWLLTREVVGAAAGRFAAALVALPPIYIGVLSLKPLAPYIEVTVLGTLAVWPRVPMLTNWRVANPLSKLYTQTGIPPSRNPPKPSSAARHSRQPRRRTSRISAAGSR